jgi:hypothetical protein
MPGEDAAKVWIDWPSTSMRWTIGSLMSRGSSSRILSIASFTSFKARSWFTSRRNSMTVCDWPSVTVDTMCLTPGMLATASSTSLVT